jgi:hypothetical protein
MTPPEVQKIPACVTRNLKKILQFSLRPGDFLGERPLPVAF